MMAKETIETFIAEITQELPEITGFTGQVVTAYSNGDVVVYLGDKELFSASTLWALRNEYNAYVAENYPEWIPF